MPLNFERGKSMKKLLGVLLVLSLFVMVFAARNYIVVGTTDKIITLDTADCYDYFSSTILDNIGAGLVDYKLGTSTLKPWLSTGWDVSDDGLTYTFHLRKDAKFSNGHKINAEVMKYSFDRAMKLNGEPAFLLTDFVKSTEVVDEYTFRVHMKYPFSGFPSVLGYTVAFPVDPAVYSMKDFNNGIPPASGPYMITSWNRDQKIVLERNPYYFGSKAKTQKIIIMFYQNAQTLRLALENGEIDVAYRTLLPMDINALKKNPNFHVYVGKGAQIREIVFDVTKKPFNNTKIREAIAYAVNRKEIASEVFAGQVEPLYTLVPMGMWSSTDVSPKRNLDKAKEILKSLGYSTSNKLEIPLWYSPSHYGPTEADAAQVLKEALEQTGMIKVDIKYAEWATYKQYWNHHNMGMFLLGWYPDYLDPDDYMWPFLSKDGAASMGCFYNNPEVQGLMKAARIVTAQDQRALIYEEVQKEALARDFAYVPLWQSTQQCVTNNMVKGVLLEPTQIFRFYVLELK